MKKAKEEVADAEKGQEQQKKEDTAAGGADAGAVEGGDAVDTITASVAAEAGWRCGR